MGSFARTCPLLLFSFCCFLSSSVSVGGWNLTVVHSGDTFGGVVAVDAANNPCEPVNSTYVSDLPPCLGGVARLAALVAQLRSARPHTLVVDTGNLLPGANYFLFSPGVVTYYAQLVGYDVVKLDLYDMQGGLSVLSSFLGTLEANGTVAVCSNLVGMQNETQLANVTVQQYTTITYQDGEKAPTLHLRLWFAGTMPTNIAELVVDPGTLDSTEEIAALQVAVGILLNEGVNKIVVAVSDIQVLDPLINGVLGIDIVLVQGQLYSNNNDTGSPIGPYPVIKTLPWKQKVCIVGVGVWGEHLGQLDVVFDDYGVIQNCSGNAIPLGDYIIPEASLQAEIAADYNRSMAGLGRVIGSTVVTLDYNYQCMFGECGVGSWTAEVLREAGNAEIGFVNGGSFGGSIPEGNITLAQFVRAFPFPADLIVTLTLKGVDLLAVLENSVSLANDTSYDISQGIGRFLQVSGVRFTFNPNEDVGMRIVNAWVQTASKRATAQAWTLVDPQQDYTISTINYVASGGDGYTILTTNVQNAETTVLTAENVYRSGFASGVITGFNTGLIVASTASRRTCIQPGGTTLCNNNGNCIAGSCICTVSGTGGQFCGTSTSSSSDNTIAIVLGTILPLAFVSVVVAVLIAVVLLGYMKYKRPKLILKEPNYQLLVWRRESMEGEVKMLPMRRLSVKVQTVLEEFLMDKHVAQAIGNVAQAKPATSDEVAAAMMLIYQSADKGNDLIRLLLRNELMGFDDEKVLFREDTPGLKAFHVFSRMVGLPYLWNMFALPIAELEVANNSQTMSSTPRTNVAESDPAPFGTIFSLTTSVEINPSMLEEGQDNSIGRLQLELILQKLLSRILTSLPYFPLYLRQLCHMLYEDMRYDHPDYVHRVLGNLIFLRFICPALLVPQNYGLAKTETHPKTHRTLILIAKVLQNLANKNDFSGKEQFMEVMNGFIHRNIGKLEEFFNSMCVPAEEPRFGDPPTSIVPRQFRKKALMLMYQFVSSHGQEIGDELGEFPPYAVQESLERLKYITRDIDVNIRDFVSDDSESESSSDLQEGTR